MNNDIIKLLNFNPDEIEITDIEIVERTKIIHIKKKLVPTYCPLCNTRMNSKGITHRNVNHPVLQDGYKLILELSERRWYCQNTACNYHYTDDFTFALPKQRQTNITPLLILNELKDLNLPLTYLSKKYNVSDTYIHSIVMRYLDPKRLPMPRILSVDEVFLDFDGSNKYALVLMDFESGLIIDILESRLKTTYDDYFLSIPLSERNNVEFVVCDMYNPYINFTVNYFHKAKAITDSFHVHQWLNREISAYIREVKTRYLKRDQRKLEEKNIQTNRINDSIKQSRDVFILNHYQWILLKNKCNINYDLNGHWNRHLQMFLNTYDYEKMFLALDDKFSEIRRLKELYVDFNHDFPKSKEKATLDLTELICTYRSTSIPLFHNFADLLEKHIDTITNSFIATTTYIGDEEIEERYRRLSNGPMEGYNRKPKDLKRNSRGVTNFEYTRTRLLWSNRPYEPILATPKPENKVHNYTYIKRGTYKKK